MTPTDIPTSPQPRSLVLSNSLGTHATMWDGLLGQLDDGWRPVRTELPGHRALAAGEAQPAFTFRDMVDEQIALLDREGVRDALFVGVSVGGAIGIAVAAARPDLISDLVVVNAPLHQASREFWLERADAVERDGLGEIAAGLWGRWFDERTPEAQSVVDDLAALSPAGYAAACRALADLDVRDDASRVSARTLVVGALDDVAVPIESSAAIAAAVSNATLWPVARGGHLLPVQRPDVLADLIRVFAASGA